jgi:phytoene dehydrogenase-like protein
MELDAASYGVRYPRGGFGRVRRRLLEQCEKVGVRVRTGAGVSVFGCIGTRLDDTACSNPDLLHAASRLISG